MTVSPDDTIGDLASRFPDTIPVFQRLRVEFCCDGQRRVGDLCRERRIAFDELAASLQDAVTAPRRPRPDWAGRSLSDLMAHLVEAFHEPLRDELPRLHAMAVKVQAHDDDSRHALAVVLFELGRFRAQLEAHLSEEERDLFALVQRAESGNQQPDDARRFQELRAVLEAEHREAGDALHVLSQATDRYQPPPRACTTVRALYRGLHELEQFMQLHSHLENNVLFPRAAALLSAARIERS